MPAREVLHRLAREERSTPSKGSPDVALEREASACKKAASLRMLMDCAGRMVASNEIERWHSSMSTCTTTRGGPMKRRHQCSDSAAQCEGSLTITWNESTMSCFEPLAECSG